MATIRDNIVRFKLTIKNFSKYYIEENREVCSQSIINYDHQGKKSEWHLVFYPDGKDFADEGYASLFLELLDSEKKAIDVIYRLYIVDFFGDEMNVKQSEVQYTEPVGWGWNRFIKLEELFQNDCLYFPQGTLTLGCDFIILPKTLKKPKLTISVNTLNEIKMPERRQQQIVCENMEKRMEKAAPAILPDVEKNNLKNIGFGIFTNLIINGYQLFKNKYLY